jgi:hypothetical protein
MTRSRRARVYASCTPDEKPNREQWVAWLVETPERLSKQKTFLEDVDAVVAGCCWLRSRDGTRPYR